jgi:hypothetical protein
MSTQCLMQTATAALSRGLLSAAQQTGSYSEQAQQRDRAANRANTLRNNSSSNGASKARASAGSTDRKVGPSAAASQTALLPRWQLSPRRGVASSNNSSKPAAHTAAASAKPSSPRSAKGVQLVPYGQTGPVSNTGMPAAAGIGGQHAASILLQVQGNFGGSTTKPSFTGAACRPASESPGEAWMSVNSGSVRSESGSESGYTLGSKIRSTPVPSSSSTAESSSSTGYKRRPALAQAGAAAVAAPGTAAPEITDDSRYYSANTAASWARDSSDCETLHVLEPPFQLQKLHTQPQAQQQRAADARAVLTDYHTMGSAFAAAKAANAAAAAMQAEAAEAATATDTAALTATAVAACTQGAITEGREVILNISPAALPFLARKALTKSPVRLVITSDAVWGEAGAFKAVSLAPVPAQPGPKPSPRTLANLNPIKAVKKALRTQGA